MTVIVGIGPVSFDDIVAVGLCGIRSCRAMVDAEGRLTEPLLSWMDARVDQPLGEVDARVALVTSAGGMRAGAKTPDSCTDS